MAGNSVLARLAVWISANTAELGKSLNRASSQLKAFQNTVKGIGAALGVSLGTAALFRGLQNVVGIMSEFEARMSEVRAITGATGDDFKALERDALRLGAATKFTASEVAELQVAFGRLGFNTKEILDATEATLALAAATGEDLAKSADVAGSTVRGFGLKAKETQRVVDVMAKSFNTTALGLENFSEAMKFVAPVAAASNLSLEETTALLGTLADAGLRGTLAGTALRKILTDLPKDGRPFQERLEELSKRGITLSDSFDEVGRTAQTALLILAKNNDKTKELAASFQNVAGEAEKMARIMQDNLQGDTEKLTSAWEGLILALGKTSFIRGATQALTSFLNALSGTPDAETGFRQLITAIKEDSAPATEAFIKNLQDIRREAGKPFDTTIVNELAEKYKLTDEQANKLFSSILEINKALSFQEKAIKLFNEFVQVKGYTDLAKAADDYKQSLYELIVAEQIKQDQFKAQAIDADGKKIFGPVIKESQEQVAAYRRVIGIINEYVKDFSSAEATVQAATTRTVVNLKFYRDALKSIGEAFEQVELGARGFNEVTSSNLRVIASEAAALDNLIDSVERVKNSFKDIGEVTFKVPDLSPLLNPIKDVEKTFGGLTINLDQTLSEEMVERFEAGIDRIVKASKKGADAIKKEFSGIDLRPLVANALEGIGESIGLAISGTQNLGKSLLGVFGGILSQFGKMLIAAGTGIIIAKKAFQSLNGYVAIAAGIGLIALGAAVSSSIKNLGGNFSGGAAGGSAGGSGRATNEAFGQSIQFNAKFRIEGQDLVAILDSQDNRNGRLG